MIVRIFSFSDGDLFSHIHVANYAFHNPVHEKIYTTLGNIHFIAKMYYYTFSIIRQSILSAGRHVNKNSKHFDYGYKWREDLFINILQSIWWVTHPNLYSIWWDNLHIIYGGTAIRWLKKIPQQNNIWRKIKFLHTFLRFCPESRNFKSNSNCFFQCYFF
jgi:hypothetical protein